MREDRVPSLSSRSLTRRLFRPPRENNKGDGPPAHRDSATFAHRRLHEPVPPTVACLASPPSPSYVEDGFTGWKGHHCRHRRRRRSGPDPAALRHANSGADSQRLLALSARASLSWLNRPRSSCALSLLNL